MTDQSALDHAIGELVIANRILAREDVIDDFGHVSMRHPTRPDRFLLSCSRSPAIVTRADIMEFTLDGEPVKPDSRNIYKERFIHAAAYAARDDVNAVTHHHARPVLPFTLGDLTLVPVFHMASVIGAEVGRWESQDEFGDTNMLVDSLEMGQSLARALGERRVVLMRGHGAVCAAHDLRAVCMVSIYLKENAELILKTLPHTQPAALSRGEIDKTSAMLFSENPQARAWDYWKARAGFAGV